MRRTLGKASTTGCKAAEASQAQPRPLWHVFHRAMQLSPHALPTRQTRQHRCAQACPSRQPKVPPSAGVRAMATATNPPRRRRLMTTPANRGKERASDDAPRHLLVSPGRNLRHRPFSPSASSVGAASLSSCRRSPSAPLPGAPMSLQLPGQLRLATRLFPRRGVPRAARPQVTRLSTAPRGATPPGIPRR